MKKMFAILAASALALTACGGAHSTSEDASGAKDLTIGLTYIPDTQFAPFYVAKDKGYFEAAGLNVTLRHHGAQESLMGALQAGDEDVVVAGGDEMVEAHSQGVKVVNWATMYQKYPVKILVPENSPVRSVADLKGKSIGLPGEYGENYYALLATLSHNGLTKNDVNIQYIGYTQATALASQQVDSVIGFTNSDAISIAAQGVPVRAIDPVEGGLPLVGAGLGSLDGKLDKATQEKVLGALDKAVEFMRSDSDGTLDIVAHYAEGLKNSDARATASKILAASIDLYGTGFGTQDKARWAAMVTFMHDAKLLTSDVAVDDVMVAVR